MSELAFIGGTRKEILYEQRYEVSNVDDEKRRGLPHNCQDKEKS